MKESTEPQRTRGEVELDWIDPSPYKNEEPQETCEKKELNQFCEMESQNVSDPLLRISDHNSDELRRRLAQLEEENKELRTQNHELVRDMETLAHHIEASDRSVTETQGNENDYDQIIRDLEDEIADIEREKNELAQELQFQTQQVIDLRGEKVELERSNRMLNECSNQLVLRLEESEQKYQCVFFEKDSVEQKYNALCLEHLRIKEVMRQLEKEAIETEEAMFELKQRSQWQIRSMKDDVDKYRTKYEGVKVLNGDLNDMLSESRNTFDAAQRDHLIEIKRLGKLAGERCSSCNLRAQKEANSEKGGPLKSLLERTYSDKVPVDSRKFLDVMAIQEQVVAGYKGEKHDKGKSTLFSRIQELTYFKTRVRKSAYAIKSKNSSKSSTVVPEFFAE